MDIYPTSTRTPGEGLRAPCSRCPGHVGAVPSAALRQPRILSGPRRRKDHCDSGQRTIAHALHRAMDFALAKDAVVYRAAVPENYRLSQAADYICTMELVALRYRDGEPSATDEKFFGSWSQFKKGILREMRAKRV